MLHLVIGIAQSGKSQYAENLISRLPGKKVYIGTLPDIPQYQYSLRLHRARRPKSWSLIELIGDLSVDVDLITDAVSNVPNVLIDGLTFYLLQLLTVFNENFVTARPQVVSLIDRAAYSEGVVIITDPPVPQHLPKQVSEAGHILLRYMHAMLARRASTITLIDNGEARLIARNELLRLDRLRSDLTDDPRLSTLPVQEKGNCYHA